MNKQLELVAALFSNLKENVAYFIVGGGHSMGNDNWCNKNHGKTAIKRKITLLRQELLNLERMLDNG